MELRDRDVQKLKEPLNDKQLLFCKEYLTDFNGSRAAKAAGYSEKSAPTTANDILNYPYVQAYLSYLISSRAKRLEVTADKVVQEIAKIAFHNVEDLLDYFDGNVLFNDLDQMKFPEIIKNITIKETIRNGQRIGQVAKIEVYDKVKALELLGKYTAIFTETLNLKNNGGKFDTPQQVTNVYINHRSKGEELAE